jgi:hypothetical protein
MPSLPRLGAKRGEMIMPTLVRDGIRRPNLTYDCKSTPCLNSLTAWFPRPQIIPCGGLFGSPLC